jgi:hypothetical protein
MEFTRNHYFGAGVVLLLLGLQLRMVHSFVLTPEVTKAVMKQSEEPEVQLFSAVSSAVPGDAEVPRKVLTPPEWLGYCLLSVGGVLVLHSLAMRPTAGGGA